MGNITMMIQRVTLLALFFSLAAAWKCPRCRRPNRPHSAICARKDCHQSKPIKNDGQRKTVSAQHKKNSSQEFKRKLAQRLAILSMKPKMNKLCFDCGRAVWHGKIRCPTCL